MNELKVSVKSQAGTITCNFEELEESLKAQMVAYEILEVTEDNLKERAADVATLRKIRKAVEDRRKEVKKEYNAPLNDFEAKVKKLTAILDGQISRIDGQIKLFDQKRIAEKQEHIQTLYVENVGEYELFLPLSRIRSPRWDNKICKDSEIIFDIQEAVAAVRSDLDTIHALGSDIEEKLIEVYRRESNSLQAAIRMNRDYIEAAEARRKAEEARKEEAQKEAETRRDRKEEARTTEIRKETTETMTVTVRGAEDIAALREFLEFSGIEYVEV